MHSQPTLPHWTDRSQCACWAAPGVVLGYSRHTDSLQGNTTQGKDTHTQPIVPDSQGQAFGCFFLSFFTFYVSNSNVVGMLQAIL